MAREGFIHAIWSCGNESARGLGEWGDGVMGGHVSIHGQFRRKSKLAPSDVYSLSCRNAMLISPTLSVPSV